MQSKTKVKLNENQIQAISEKAFHEKCIKHEEVMNGFYNAIYRLYLSDRNVYLKIAPGDDIDILTYEKNIMTRECKIYEICERLGIPVPHILFHDSSKDIISAEYYIMSEISGLTLFELKDEILDKSSYYIELMEYVARLHNQKALTFGYDSQDIHFDSYGETIMHMFNNVIKDAKKKDIVFPEHITALLNKLPEYTDLLSKLKTPSILHYDLWDGNIMVHEGKITGIIDAERSFNGHPIADFVCMSFNIFDDEFEYLIPIYNQYSDYKIKKDKETKILYYIHKVYLFFIMYVECSYRDIEGSFDWQRNWANDELRKFLDILNNN